MMTLMSDLVVSVYFAATGILMFYSLNCYVMILLFWIGRRKAEARRRQMEAQSGDLLSRQDLPIVTTQIAVYNELNVAERAMEAACAMQYPPGRHEIQILDDSTDETREVIDQAAARLRSQGHDIHVIRRNHREGFKAGALANGTSLARGELLAVFDADFVPPPDYLTRTVPYFLVDPDLGLVQARWGHLNSKSSLITRAQSIGIDGHFMVEQGARNFNGLYMNFNGTAGIWRRTAIAAGGGWHWDTLTEDMDLSYRVQFAGWGTLFLPDLVVPAEVPEDIGAFKSQQFRWAKGSIQTAIKLFPELMRQPVSFFKKLQAVFHMTHYLVHPMMLILSLLALPVLLSLDLHPAPLLFLCAALAMALSMMAPTALYVVSQRVAYRDWYRQVLYLPFLAVMGVGIALSNTRAVCEAVMGVESPFVRTPKKGDRERKRYRVRLPLPSVFEIMIGIYCVFSLHIYLSAGKYLVGPFLAIYAAGFVFVGLLSLAHGLGYK